jgi:hypothetical protein
MSYYPKEEARFIKDTAEHEMTILHNDGLYRHLRFKKPGTRFYWFDLITWPGYLTIAGDMGTFTFERTEDMLTFFRGAGDINPQYWSEKIRPNALLGVKVIIDPTLTGMDYRIAES